MQTQIVYFLIILALILFDTFRSQIKYNQKENMKKQKKYDAIKRKMSQTKETNMEPYNIVNDDEDLIKGNWHPSNFMNTKVVIHKN
tara:strand:- start:74 stop:331 length:258 start_codon:yes stop_codon:yes gene_type:complete